MTILTRTIQALAIVVIAGGAGFLAYRLTARHTSTITVAPAATVPHEDQAPLSQAPAPRQIPEVVPELALPDGGGVRRQHSEWKGHPTLFNFWATWCEPCRREIPLLLRLRREHAADGVEVVGIAVDSRDAVLKYARDMHIDYPVLVGEQEGFEAVQAFGMETVLPFTVFTDSQARIVTLKVGELHPDEAAFILDRVKDVDSGRLALADARRQIAAEIAQLSAERARAATQDPSDSGR
jgi:thiol-disulfide isomerase/thioredoxin